jgi:hypothetical protein
MATSAEYAALKAKQHAKSSLITISVREEEKPKDWHISYTNGHVKIYGKLKRHQRDYILSHLGKYVELLVKEAEDKNAFDARWDSYQ